LVPGDVLQSHSEDESGDYGRKVGVLTAVVTEGARRGVV
jgi:hypothetical protein